MKITFDQDIPEDVRPQIEEVIKETIEGKCSCGSDEVYVAVTDGNTIDVKCYDCGESFFELEVEIEYQEKETQEQG